MEPPKEKLLFSLRETAATLGVSDRTIFAMTQPRGSLVPTRIGSRVMYSRKNIEAWIESQSRVEVQQ